MLLRCYCRTSECFVVVVHTVFLYCGRGRPGSLQKTVEAAEACQSFAAGTCSLPLPWCTLATRMGMWQRRRAGGATIFLAWSFDDWLYVAELVEAVA